MHKDQAKMPRRTGTMHEGQVPQSIPHQLRARWSCDGGCPWGPPRGGEGSCRVGIPTSCFAIRTERRRWNYVRCRVSLTLTGYLFERDVVYGSQHRNRWTSVQGYQEV